MKRLILLLGLVASFSALADTKISQLPLGTAATTATGDVFPYVDTTNGVTKKMRLWDLLNLPPWSTFNAATATALAATPSQCTSGQFATGIAANGNANCATPVGGGSVTSVTASSPLASSGGATPDISCQVASGSQAGCLSSTDWSSFNGKQSALTFADSLSNSGGTVTLANDSATPGASQYYGTDSSSVLGYHSLPSGATGSVNSVSVVSANGFAGTVANSTTTPAITLSTNITGMIKGNGTAISAATSGTDYQAPIADHACSSHQWMNQWTAPSTYTCSQPDYSDLTGTPTLRYQTVQLSGTNQTQRSKINFSSNFSLSDSLANDRTDVDLATTISADTSGSAASLSAASALPNGTTATTQAASDNSTKVATTAYVDAAVAAGGGGGGGTTGFTTTTKTTTYTAAPGDWIRADASSGGFTITSFAASGNTDKAFCAKKIDVTDNVVTIAFADLVDGYSNAYLYHPGDQICFITNGSTFNAY